MGAQTVMITPKLKAVRAPSRVSPGRTLTHRQQLCAACAESKHLVSGISVVESVSFPQPGQSTAGRDQEGWRGILGVGPRHLAAPHSQRTAAKAAPMGREQRQVSQLSEEWGRWKKCRAVCRRDEGHMFAKEIP